MRLKGVNQSMNRLQHQEYNQNENFKSVTDGIRYVNYVVTSETLCRLTRVRLSLIPYLEEFLMFL